MSWLRIDDGFTKHPKFEGWPPTAKWAWLEVMEYCARYRTQGRIPTDLNLLPRSVTQNLINRAHKSGWCTTGTDGAQWVNDWTTYNPTDPTKAERQARWRKNRDTNGDTHVDGDVDANGDIHVDTQVDDPVDAQVDAQTVYLTRAPARPFPSRPVPKEQKPFLPAEVQYAEGRQDELNRIDPADELAASIAAARAEAGLE